jgi:hypothetical protein
MEEKLSITASDKLVKKKKKKTKPSDGKIAK